VTAIATVPGDATTLHAGAQGVRGRPRAIPVGRAVGCQLGCQEVFEADCPLAIVGLALKLRRGEVAASSQRFGRRRRGGRSRSLGQQAAPPSVAYRPAIGRARCKVSPHMPEPVDLRELTQRLADRDSQRTEANVQSDVRTLLLYGGLHLSAPQVVGLEAPAGAGRRIDVEIGLAAIEVKRDLRPGNVKANAVKQLAGYVRDRAAELGQRYAGILTDGAEWYLYYLLPSGERMSRVLLISGGGPDASMRLAQYCSWV
jgi:hypothetical protein